MYDKIKSDLTQAMKDQDKFRLDCIRMLKSAIQMEEIAKKHELSDDEVIAVIKREEKKRNSSIAEYTKYGKEDMVKSLEKEVAILSQYLPRELSEEELVKIIDESIKKTEAASIKDMGKVIKDVASQVGSRADMSKVSSIVKEKLS